MRGGRNLGSRIATVISETSVTSEPDSAPPRRPPTIDLKATEIEAQQAGGPGEAGEPASSGQSSSDQETAGHGSTTKAAASPGRPSVMRHILSVAAGAVAAAAILAGLYYGGIYPPAAPVTPPPAAVAGNAADSASAKISSQLANIEARLRSQPDASTFAAQLANIQAKLQSQPDASTFTAQLAKVEAQTKTLSDSLAAVNQRLDRIAVAAQGARTRADEAAAAAKGATASAVQHSDLDALSSRIAALEGEIKSLSEAAARRAVPRDDRAARGAVASAALRAAVERGAPFASELAAVKSFGADHDAVAALEPFAASGVPSAGDLGRELAQLTDSLRQASGTKPPDATFLGRLEDNARNLVHITPVNAPPGNEPAAVISRLDAEARHADLAAALADVAHLPPAARTIASPWVAKVNARDAAIAASRRIATDALAALATTKTR